MSSTAPRPRPTSRRIHRIPWALTAARSWRVTRRCGLVGGAHLIFRLCWVYGARGQNFMLTMMRLARERETLRVVGDQTGCPTWSRMIAEATAQAVKQAVAARDIAAFTGTYHLASSGTTSWHGFADAIVKLMPAEGRKCYTSRSHHHRGVSDAHEAPGLFGAVV